MREETDLRKSFRKEGFLGMWLLVMKNAMTGRNPMSQEEGRLHLHLPFNDAGAVLGLFSLSAHSSCSCMWFVPGGCFKSQPFLSFTCEMQVRFWLKSALEIFTKVTHLVMCWQAMSLPGPVGDVHTCFRGSFFHLSPFYCSLSRPQDALLMVPA